jgi:hypothetical protein
MDDVKKKSAAYGFFDDQPTFPDFGEFQRFSA